MQRKFSKVAIVSAAFVVILGLTMVIRGDEALRQRTGFPQDWSHSHLIFSDPGTFAQAVRNGSVAHWYKIMNDPRYQVQQLRRNAAMLQPNAAALRTLPLKPAPPKSTPVAKDWNFSLQTTGTFSGVSLNRYPAKYSFNETGASCTNDFIIYGLYTDGSSTQANLVGVNNIYVGAAGGGGCGSISNNGGNGTAPTPQVNWAFNVLSSYFIKTSVVLSLDGTKAAYVASTLSAAQLQVLTLGSGTAGHTCGAAPCSVDNPSTPGNFGSSLSTLNLSSSTAGDTNSSVYVDYANDIGYVGDNSGHLYKIYPLFGSGSGSCTAPSLSSTCTGWSTNPISAGTSFLASPVYDGATGTVFVGSYDGNLYGFHASDGSAITGSPLALATIGSAGSGGIFDAPPIVDSTNHVLYEFFGGNAILDSSISNGTSNCGTAGNCAEVAQVVFTGTPTLSSTATSSLSTAGTNLAAFSNTSGNTFYNTDGAFSQSYFSGFDSTKSFLYACGAYSTTSTAGVTLQQFNFNTNRILQTTAHAVNNINETLTVTNILASGGEPCGPPTEFYNTNGTATDYLFLSVPALTSSNFLSFNITNNTSGGALTSTASSTYVAGGASGMIVDGADPTTNASSIYFTSNSSSGATCTTSSTASPANTGIGSVATAICAYKLTQSGLL